MKQYIELELNSKKMRGYEDQQSDECVVLFHGFTGHKTETGGLFRKIADDLSAIHISTVRFDWFGHGESDYLFQEIRVPLLLEQAQVILNYAFSKYKTVHLLGFSMGGAFAIQSSTNKLTSLILLAPAINMGHIALDHFPEGSTAETVDLNTFVLHRDFATGFLGLEYPSKVQAFTHPVQIIHGVLDAAVPIQGSRNLVQTYPNAQLLEIKKSNHLFSTTVFQKQVVDTIKLHLKQIKK